MKPKFLTHWLILASASLTGCTTWNPATMSRPLPIAESREPESPIRFSNLPKSDDEHSIDQADRRIQKSVADLEGHSLSNRTAEATQPPFALPTWPDSLYWEDVYRQINDADTRRVENGKVINPLQPLPARKRLQEPERHEIANDVLQAIPQTPRQQYEPQELEPRESSTAAVVDPWVRAANFETPEVVWENSSRSRTSCVGLSGLTVMCLHAAEVCSGKGIANELEKPPTISMTGSPNPKDFRQKLSELRSALKVELADQTNTADRKKSLQLAQQIVVLLENKDAAVPAVAGYLEPQISAIETLLNDSGATDMASFGRKAGETLGHLRAAEAALQAAAGLKIQNANFCTEVLGFGQFRECKSISFIPQQQVLIYCEVENHVSKVRNENSQINHFTRLQTALTICNANKVVMQQIDFPTVEDVARSARRDFYLYVPFTIGNLPPGNYSLYLTVTDLEGNKTTTLDPPLEFSVR